jgi:hypothetical protein
MKRIVLLALLCGVASACGDGNDVTGPSGTQVSGTWVGTITEAQSGSANLRMTLSQNDDTLTGTWSASGAGGSDGGSLAGRLSGGALTVTLEPFTYPSDQCRFNLTASVAGTRMTGTFAGLTCGFPVSGSVDVTKQ